MERVCAGDRVALVEHQGVQLDVAGVHLRVLTTGTLPAGAAVILGESMGDCQDKEKNCGKEVFEILRMQFYFAKFLYGALYI